MDAEQRKALVDQTYTFRGHKAYAAGWFYEDGVTLTSCLRGFYRVTWDELLRASKDGGEVLHATFWSSQWLGMYCDGCA